MATAKSKASAKKGRGNDAMVAAEIGAGILAAAGAAAAGYYYYGSNKASANRKKTAKWAKDLKNQVEKEAKKQMKTVSKLDKAAVAMIVDRASKAYQTAKNVRPEDVMAAANELKQNWEQVQREVASTTKKVTKAAKKVVKKATKKAPAKKVAKKAAKKR